jgi:transposase
VPAPLSIRADRAAAKLRRLARRERDGRVSARLLALANALDGLPRAEAARLADMTGQTLGDWVHRDNAEGFAGLRDRPRPGRPCALEEGRQAALKLLKGLDLAWQKARPVHPEADPKAQERCKKPCPA